MRFLTLLCLLLSIPVVNAQIVAHRDELPGGYNFWFYMPPLTPTADAVTIDSTRVIHRDTLGHALKPLIVSLHGQSYCGRNLYSVLRQGNPMDALQRGLEVDAYIIAPQNPGTAWDPDKVWQTVEWAKANYAIDTCRIYAIGMSLGGYGVLNFAAAYHDRLAAVLGMCGGCSAKDVSGLCSMPLWIAHGTADEKVPFSCSSIIQTRMKKAGTTDRLVFTRLEGANHGIFARSYYWKTTYQWLFSHSLDDPGRPVRRDLAPQMTRTNLSGKVYQELGGWRTKGSVPIFDNGKRVNYLDDGRAFRQ